MEDNKLKYSRRYSFLSQIVKLCTQFLGGVVIAKIIGPKYFGVYAASMTVMNLMYVIKDFGFGAVVINRDMEENDISAIFFLNILLGLFLSLIVFFFSEEFAHFLAVSNAGAVLKIMSPVFFIQSLYLINVSLMEKNFNFKKIAVIESLASIFGFLIAFALVLNDFKYVGIALQSVATSVFTLFFVYFGSNWRPSGFILNFKIINFLNYGAGVFYSNLINYASRNIDVYFIGLNMGEKILGMYSMSYKIMFMPIQNISQVIARASFPIMSENYRNKSSIENIYSKNIKIIFNGIFPGMLSVFIFRENLIKAIFDDRWSGMSGYLAYLVPIGMLQVVLSSTGCVYMAIQKTKIMTMLSFLGFILQAPIFYFSGNYEIDVLLKYLLISNGVNFFLSMSVFFYTTKFSFVCMTHAVRPLLLCLIFILIPGFVYNNFLNDHAYVFYLVLSSALCVSISCIYFVKKEL